MISNFENICVMAKLSLFIVLICCLKETLEEEHKNIQVCKETEILRKLYENKPLFKDVLDRRALWNKWRKPSPRSLLKALQNCSDYHGDIWINVHSTGDTYKKFDENVRSEDLLNLNFLKRINGVVYLDLGQYRDIKNLSFFGSLRMIENSEQPGFALRDSYVEMFGFVDLRLNVASIDISDNFYLCYLENIWTINSSIEFRTERNRESSTCAREGKVCSGSCSSRKGCWGPTSRHCFECQHWRAGNECVDSCDLKRGFFTPSEGRVCGRCKTCDYQCVGAGNTQCPEPNDHCMKHMFYNNVTRRCEECAPSCFGAGYGNRTQLIVRACIGPENVSGPGGCSRSCPGLTFLTISPNGLLECFPCHEGCLTCENASMSACLQWSKVDSRENESIAMTILGWVSFGFLICVVGLCCMELWRRRLRIWPADEERAFTFEVPLLTMTNNPSLGENLLVRYDANDFSPVPYRGRIQCREGDELLSCFKCHVPELTDGWKSFTEITEILGPLFTGKKIEQIRQDLGKVAEIDVARVTYNDDEMTGLVGGSYCGKGLSPEELENTWQHKVDANNGRRILITSGRRTVLGIRHIAPYDILVSYERSSEEVIRKIYEHLVAKGFSCRMVEQNEENEKARLEEIDNCRVMLICFTEEYLKSQTFIKEIDYAHWSRQNSSFPVILPIVSVGMKWPPRDADKRVRKILSQEHVRKNACRMQESDYDNLVKELRRLILGVKLLVIYDEDHFTPIDGDQIQYRGKYDLSGSFIKCHVPQMKAGWKSFGELLPVLASLFTGKDIEEIEQDRGKVAGKDVTKALSRDDEVVNPWGGPYCDIDGKEHSWREVEMPRQYIINAGCSCRVLIVEGRRTVMEIGHKTSSEEQTSYKSTTRFRLWPQTVESDDDQ